MSAGLRWLLGTFALITSLLLALTLERVAERGRFARAFSSYGSGPEGTRALYLLTAELGFSPLRWAQDLARLPPRSMLVALGDCGTGMARPMSRYERDELLRWMAGGGVLLVAGSRHYIPPGLGVEFESDPRCTDSADARDPARNSPDESTTPPVPDAPDAGMPRARDAHGGTAPLEVDDAGTVGRLAPPPEDDGDAPRWGVPMDQVLRGLPIVPFREPGRLKLSSEARADTLLGVPELDRVSSTSSLLPLAVALRYGQGRLIVLASANMLQNAELDTSEGATLFARLLRAYGNVGPVLFDEYHLGTGERRSLMQYLRQLGAMPGVLQLVLCAVVLLWRAGARFGGVRRVVAPSPGGTTSFVTALGGLYQGAGDAAAAVRLIGRAALARIAAHHAIGSVRAAALERALDQRGATQASQAVRSIVAAVSSTPTRPLPTIVQAIDAAVASANATADTPSIAASRARARVFGWPARRR